MAKEKVETTTIEDGTGNYDNSSIVLNTMAQDIVVFQKVRDTKLLILNALYDGINNNTHIDYCNSLSEIYKNLCS